MKIEEVDPNFLPTKVDAPDIVWYDAANAPFSVHGSCTDFKDEYMRMPEGIASSISTGVAWLNRHTAGIRVRFATDSDYIALSTVRKGVVLMAHMTPTGICGFDMYADGKYAATYQPKTVNLDAFSAIAYFENRGKREIEINFPLYGNVGKLYIGVRKDAQVEAPKPYKHEKPIVFYGSSITQGGCATRPGLSYQGHIERWFDTDFINLGFSGNAHGDEEMAHFIASLDSSVTVLDYDHNSSIPELSERHEKFYRIIRAAKPTQPIVFVTKPDSKNFNDKYNADTKTTEKIIYTTYENALKRGENVYFINGQSFYPDSLRDSCSVDGCHPNDIGFLFMAKGMADVLALLLSEKLPFSSLISDNLLK